MVSPHPNRPATFVLALLLARAGLATAGTEPTDTAAAAGPRTSSASVPPTPDPDPNPNPGATPPPAWPRRIDGRLVELAQKPTQPAASDPTPAAPAALRRVLSRAPRNARIAIRVEHLESGKVFVDRDGDRHLNPASNQKILSAVAAVDLLGPDYRFETRVVRHGDTLTLVGEGDPTLQVDDLYRLAAEVATAVELPEIRRLRVDDRAFDRARFAPGYDPTGPGASYMAPSGALSMQFNTVEIVVQPGEFGGPAEVRTSPECAHVRIDSSATTGHGRPLTIETHEDNGATVVRVRGSIPAGHAGVTKRRRIVDPGLYVGTTFAEILASMGTIDPPTVERGAADSQGQVVATRLSPPLPRALESGLKYSNNFVAEQTLRTLAWRATGRPGSWSDGVELLHRYLRALGLDDDRIAFENGSGLSTRGRLSPKTLVQLVRRADDLLPSLPISGRDGTLRARMELVDGLVRAKTGTMGGVSALSGIAGTGDERLAFSILVNGRLSTRRARALQDHIVVALLNDRDQG